MVRLAPRRYAQITAVALGLLALIVVTGAAVRLTGSGLGCPEWPTCGGGRVVAPLEYHAMVEFVNRVVTGFVSVAVIVAVLGSLVRVPRRRDLVWLSLGLVAGVLGQIVLGGLVVLFHLWPPLVMGHFVVSMALLADGTVLHHRAVQPEGGEVRLCVDRKDAPVGRVLLALAAVVIGLGTEVTGAGPHAGSHDGELVERLPIPLHDIARLHGIAVFGFLGAVLFALARFSTGAPSVRARTRQLLVVVVLQGALGYAQYFLGVPPVLVALHVAGASAVWIATLRVYLSLRVRVPVDAPEPVATAA